MMKLGGFIGTEIKSDSHDWEKVSFEVFFYKPKVDYADNRP